MTWLSQGGRVRESEGGRPLSHTEGREHWLTSLLSRTHSVSQHLSSLSLERISLLGGSVNTFIRELPGDHKHSGESSVSLNCVKLLVPWLHIPVLHNVTHIHSHVHLIHNLSHWYPSSNPSYSLSSSACVHLISLLISFSKPLISEIFNLIFILINLSCDLKWKEFIS